MKHCITLATVLSVLSIVLGALAAPARAQDSPVTQKLFVPLVGQGAMNAGHPRREGQQRDLASAVFALVNAERVKAGCAPLKEDSRLVGAAEQQSEKQAIEDYYSHRSPVTREGVDTFAKARGYVMGASAILAVGGGDPSTPFQVESSIAAWLASPPHKGAMLRCEYVDGGVGIYYQPSDEGNVQAVNFLTATKVPFGDDGYSTDPGDGVKVRGPYYYYITAALSYGSPAAITAEDSPPVLTPEASPVE
jgi:uncharacterized protein YkwD